MPTLPPRPHRRPARADSALVQPLMEEFAKRQAAAGRRVAGVVQARIPDADRSAGQGAIVLKNIATGALYPISQDLGKGSVPAISTPTASPPPAPRWRKPRGRGRS